MLRRKMSLALLLVGAVVLGSVGTARASSCAPLVGAWLVDTKSTTALAASDFQCPLGWDNVQREWRKE